MGEVLEWGALNSPQARAAMVDLWDRSVNAGARAPAADPFETVPVWHPGAAPGAVLLIVRDTKKLPPDFPLSVQKMFWKERERSRPAFSLYSLHPDGLTMGEQEVLEHLYRHRLEPELFSRICLFYMLRQIEEQLRGYKRILRVERTMELLESLNHDGAVLIPLHHTSRRFLARSWSPPCSTEPPPDPSPAGVIEYLAAVYRQEHSQGLTRFAIVFQEHPDPEVERLCREEDLRSRQESAARDARWKARCLEEAASEARMKTEHPRWGQWPDVRPQELKELVWRHTATQVAALFGVSDSAVGKKCRSLGIAKPPRGYWQKLAARGSAGQS